MAHYIALIHKDSDTGYGVSFPDVPGVTTVGDTIDDAMHKAADVLTFAAEDWHEQTGRDFPAPRTIDALRADKIFQEDAVDAVVALVPFRERGRMSRNIRQHSDCNVLRPVGYQPPKTSVGQLFSAA